MMTANNLAYQHKNDLFVQAYADLSWPELLRYYQHKPDNAFLPLSSGKRKHLALADEIVANRFTLNNECHHLPENFAWQFNPSTDLEWLILLHKFYYLKDLACAYDFTQDEKYAQKWVALISTWIAQVPEGFIDTQVTGRRLQQWLMSFRYFVMKWQSLAVTPDFFAQFIQSVNSQACYLCEHLTLEGNHRTLELYAIFVVALTFPELSLAPYFLEFSKEKLLENIQQDLLPDGVHRELSTDYHHTVLKNYLRFIELASINQIPLPDTCHALIQEALVFSCYAHKPDGFIPAINDGDCNSYLPLLKKAFGIYANQHLHYVLTQGDQGIAPPCRSRVFKNSGYCILRSDWAHQPYQEAHYLFFDCAALGFGSHGHYDALNIEIAAYGHSLIVDPGRYTYSENSGDDNINWRKYFKSTAAHNTVVIDGMDQMAYQCERPTEPEPNTSINYFASCNGYDLAVGKVMSHRYPVAHERTIFYLHAEYWVMTDRMLTDSHHNYDLYFHLHNRAQHLTEATCEKNGHIIYSPNLLIAQPKQSSINLTIEQGYISPEYGIKQVAPIVKFSIKESSNSTFHTILYPFRDNAPAVAIEYLAVSHGKIICENFHAIALKIKLNHIQNNYQDIFFLNHSSLEKVYAFAEFTCACKMLFIRRDEYGHIINLQAEAVDLITVNSINLFTHLGGLVRISFQEGTLILTQHCGKKTLRLSGLTALPDWHHVSALWEQL